MRPPLPYGQSEDAFSGFGAGKFRFLLYARVAPGNLQRHRKNRLPAVR